MAQVNVAEHQSLANQAGGSIMLILIWRSLGFLCHCLSFWLLIGFPFIIVSKDNVWDDLGFSEAGLQVSWRVNVCHSC